MQSHARGRNIEIYASKSNKNNNLRSTLSKYSIASPMKLAPNNPILSYKPSLIPTTYFLTKFTSCSTLNYDTKQKKFL